ncbi:O-methyltransferase [Vibrio nigripulchritudo]|uniref:Polyketide synthesis O-methyltransferase, TcmP n=1 Tax=Vibrio nigripulchritudo SOn1 TaxID=1238450 RepID=A0AAV2VKX4_9VIBR|nr:class I SAM-dependent methyltransferase [Vibrio nigripulchritudo]KJY67520.1 methyltransferase [Vibrio nigripulchritudo]CCO45352.1 putative Polyketide synthesis O-methyltransferase, TcmP [Vibrio nigripulchritudo SOn1]BCL68218.1 O-methyltransferase [Vibrio nigripulchritudo]BDU29546.1 O-methyltransferase [Vibrio nigripulchritudo]BDU35671.1 O-methyltransferase [Vibrio nigripulchritudo]
MTQPHFKRPKSHYRIPANLLQPMWLRSRESLVDDGLVYDPIAASACQRCELAPECLAGDVDQKQLLNATLTQLCDERVKNFLIDNPEAWVLNVGAGLDTRFYRLDNGRCHWLELDISENLLWRQKLFHPSERYQLRCGSVVDTNWLGDLPVPDSSPVLIVCEHALLDCEEEQVAKFIQTLGRRFIHAQACIVVAGDLANSHWGKKLGGGGYKHAIRQPKEKLLSWLPWYQWATVHSPMDKNCSRWKRWQRLLSKMSFFKHRMTPVLLHMRW